MKPMLAISLRLENNGEMHSLSTLASGQIQMATDLATIIPVDYPMHSRLEHHSGQIPTVMATVTIRN